MSNQLVVLFFYGHITNIIQNACDIIKGGRDIASVANLNKCDQFQFLLHLS